MTIKSLIEERLESLEAWINDRYEDPTLFNRLPDSSEIFYGLVRAFLFEESRIMLSVDYQKITNSWYCSVEYLEPVGALVNDSNLGLKTFEEAFMWGVQKAFSQILDEFDEDPQKY